MPTELSAEEYCKEHWLRNLNRTKHRKRFADIASFLHGNTCIDVGCAAGHSTTALAELFPAVWTGCDFSSSAIAAAMEMNSGCGIDFRYVPKVSLLPELGSFDSVVCSEVIEHVEDDLALVNSLVALAAKTVIITTPCKVVDDPGHLRTYTQGTLVDLCGDFCASVMTLGAFLFVVIDIPLSTKYAGDGYDD